MRPPLRRASRLVVAVGAVVALAAGCSGSPSTSSGADDVAVPQGFDVPKGVTLTPGGTTLDQDEPASAVFEVGTNATSAITVTVTTIRKGELDDFRFFSLDDASKASTPYYVSATVTNEGPAGLGGATLPLFAHDSSNTIVPATQLVGTFKPCPAATLPETFLPGASAKLCLVYLVPEGQQLESIDLQTTTAKDAIAWRP